jgi:glutamate-5-semialdehyde dehydrogenase
MAGTNNELKNKAEAARAAALVLANLKDSRKRAALKTMAAALRANADAILKANAADVAEARRAVATGKMSQAMLKRLMVDKAKIDGMAEGVESVAKLTDPVGRTLSEIEMDDGLVLEQVSCPIGVIGAIFESRPDVVPQISALCLKSGNAVILKGGSEAARTNRVLKDTLCAAAEAVPGVPAGWAQLIETRREVKNVLAMDEYIDLLVPRGSNEFVRYIQDNTRIPVLGHADGVCHVYIDKGADWNLAIAIAIDSKTQYPAACNAAETILVHKDIAAEFLPQLARALADHNVEVRGCSESRRLAKGVKAAKPSDWDAEYLDMIVSLKVVDSIETAVCHINKHGSKHTDSIVTEAKKSAEYFFRNVDSACVFLNASTRFSDGFRFGKGAEIGISTNKTHARGPVGLEGLVIYKYLLKGSGQIVDDYMGPHAKKFKHRKIR